MGLFRGLLARACVNSGSVGLSMRLFRGLLAQACVNSGSVGLSMRLFRSLLARACVNSGSVGLSSMQACVYFGVCWPEHASIPGSARPARQFRDRSALSMRLIPGSVGPEHASIPGSVGLSMRLFRGLLAQACVNSGSVGLSMRLFRSLLARACVNSGIGRPEHASISGSAGPSMRQFRARSARACVYSTVSGLHTEFLTALVWQGNMSH